MTRSDHWKEPRFIPISISRSNSNPALLEAIDASPEKPESGGLTQWRLVEASKELILRVVEQGFEIDFVDYSLDAATGTLRLGKSWTALELDDEVVKSTLAAAVSLDVPVYPDDDAAAEHLERLYISLFEDGFTRRSDGKDVTYRWTGPRRPSVSESGLLDITPGASVFPADLLAISRAVKSQQGNVSTALRVITGLKAATADLRAILERKDRNEHELQACLTANPLLFGFHYDRVVPKYKLGKNYELDYALVEFSGRVDVVEIEASTHQLFTKSGDPRACLVHAEQQVLDWLDWLESNMRQARDDLPGMVRPIGQVVIGRRSDLSSEDSRRLRRRNATWRGVISILTYDDLLERAESVLARLTPESEPNQGN